MLLHFAGERVYDIYAALPEPEAEDGDGPAQNQYEVTKRQLTTYFAPHKSTDYAVYMFRSPKQQPGQTLDQYHTKLCQLALNCEFPDLHRELKGQIIMSGSSARLRRRALRDPTLTLTGLLPLGRAMEAADRQAAGMENGGDPTKLEVNKLSQKFKPTLTPMAAQPTSKPRTLTCFGCGGAYPHPDGQQSCPARGKECAVCHKPITSLNIAILGEATTKRARGVLGDNSSTENSSSNAPTRLPPLSKHRLTVIPHQMMILSSQWCGMGASRFSIRSSADLVAVVSHFSLCLLQSYEQTSTTRVGWNEALSAFISDKVNKLWRLRMNLTVALDWTGLSKEFRTSISLIYVLNIIS